MVLLINLNVSNVVDYIYSVHVQMPVEYYVTTFVYNLYVYLGHRLISNFAIATYDYKFQILQSKYFWGRVEPLFLCC